MNQAQTAATKRIRARRGSAAAIDAFGPPAAPTPRDPLIAAADIFQAAADKGGSSTVTLDWRTWRQLASLCRRAAEEVKA